MGQLPEYINRIASWFRQERKEKDTVNTWTGLVTKDISVKSCPFAVFDMELSGLDPKRDFIVSIGAVKMTGGTIHTGREFYRLVRPSGEMTKKSVEIHGITPDELKNAEEPETVLHDFLDFIKDSVIAGHFVNIDIGFLNEALKKMYSGKLQNPAVDTHNLHEWLYENGIKFRKHYQGGSTKTDLFSIAQSYGITVYKTHNALNDAFITAQLLQRFVYFLQAEGVRNLSDLLDIGKA